MRVAADCTTSLLSRVQPWSDVLSSAAGARHVLVLSDRAGRDQLYLADTGGGAVRAVTDLGVDVRDGSVSPDGAWLAYARTSRPGCGSRRSTAARRRAGSPRRRTARRASRTTGARSASSAARACGEIVEVPLDTGAAPRVRCTLPRWITSLTYAADGREILASVEYVDGDLWLAEGQFR